MKNWWLKFLVIVVAAALVDKGADWILTNVAFSAPTRVLIALLPVPGNVAIIAAILGRIRRLDEFQQRRHFEAIVVGFLGTGVAVFIHAYLIKAHAVGTLSAARVWLFMALSYFAGYVLAVRRYR